MEINSAKYLVSSPKLEGCPKPDKPEYAFIGRSNVGKSSLINMLTRNAKLAKTSASPGKTQLINHFLINEEFYIVDLPGYGYAKVSQTQRAQWEKMIEHYLRERENLMTVFVLIDSRHTPQMLDLQFLRNLGEWGVPFNVIFTKADKSTQRDAAKNARFFIEEMKKEWEFIPRTFMSSAIKFTGRKEVLTFIDELNQEFFEEHKKS
ncbi:MAG: YihA family ribosome biogenesis GTP-binding protein [Bacteroidetes bacterium]|nr:YihA family ribosome biogenesis GTP-binding protein [Bacteroidota bacterium]MBS1738973.1 YihA family ribosome biogenesis GTP-binding protein [Bacteroidota bacterium]MBS1775472.1 YihA family ribosome biogenesis GTP-binding protein [Bacteroidota bacterium]